MGTWKWWICWVSFCATVWPLSPLRYTLAVLLGVALTLLDEKEED